MNERSFFRVFLLGLFLLPVAACGDPKPIIVDAGAPDGGDGSGQSGDGDSAGDGDSSNVNTTGDGDGDGDGVGDGDSSTTTCPNGYGRVRGECLADNGTACEADGDCIGSHCVAGVCCSQKCEDGNSCQTASCEDGSTCVYDDIDDCTLDNGELCEGGLDCESGFCVNGICCAQACDSPPACRQIEGTFCIDEGTVCDYGKLANETLCDDGDGCTIDEWCINGTCTPQDVNDCDDGDDCTIDTCESPSGACSSREIVPETDCPDDNNPCTDPICTDNAGAGGGGCGIEPNDDPCDDGDACTENDFCEFGFCNSGSEKDCSSADGECAVGVCSGGSCVGNGSMAQGDDCTSTVTACDLGGMCNASGGCAVVGAGEACGDNASMCQLCGGPSQPACNDGTGRNCTCDEDYEQRDGVCELADDECDPNTCGAHTTCTDTPGVNNKVCGCEPGYEPIGATADGGCEDIDECMAGTHNCGGQQCNNTDGGFTCGCPDPQMFVDGECRCELEGTFVQVSTVDLTWSGIDGVADAPSGGFRTYGWALRHQTIDQDGNLEIDMIPCGGTAPDVCDTVFDLAHTQYQPNSVWGGDGMPRPNYEVPASGFADTPGSNYDEPTIAVTMGIQFTQDDPLTAEWPCSAECVGLSVGQMCDCPDGSTMTISDPTIWLDSDLDTELGVTTVGIVNGSQSSRTQYGPGAPIDGSFPDPPVARGTRIPGECPLASGRTDWEYSWWPATSSSPFRLWGVEVFYSATRTISQLDGSLNSSCQLVGDITGPYSPAGCGTGNNAPCNQLKADARVADCEGAYGSSGYGTCSTVSANQVNSFFDEQPQTNEALAATFMIEKLDSINLTGSESAAQLNQACQEVREAYCPDGEDCSVTP